MDATGINDWRDLATAISKSLRRARDLVSGDHLVARMQLIGETPLAWRIRRDLDLLKVEADDRASIVGRCWVEKLDVQCRISSAAETPGEDPVSELRRLINFESAGTPTYSNKKQRGSRRS